MTDKVVINECHPAGRTFIAISRDGSVIYTGGCDSLVRVWKADSESNQEPDTALDSDEAITALCVDNDGWMSGSDDSLVRRYTKLGTEMESLITRANAIPIRCIAVDVKGRNVAVASDETIVKVIDLDDTTKVKLLDGHTKGVRGISWHPSGSIITSCSSDGKITVWDISEDEPKIERTLEGLIPAVVDNQSEEFGHECIAHWHPSGLYFAVATKAHEIITVSRGTWSKNHTFSDEDCIGAVTAMAFSSNGAYLASACKSGVFIWSTQTRRVVAQQDTPQGTIIHQLVFSSSFNLLAWTDSKGNLSRWPDAVPATLPSPTKAFVASTAIPTRQKTGASLFDTEGDEIAAVDGDGDIVIDEQDDDWIIDDIGDGMKDKNEKESGVLREMVSVTKAQLCFQPGSTPFLNKRRYLAFNNIGVVEVVDQDTHQIMNIEFHDQTTRKSYHFTDSFKFNLASVGERGIVYAGPPEEGHPARVHYKPYATWASLGEWTYELPSGEQAVAVAAGGTPPTRSLRKLQDADAEGNGYVVIATNKGYIRFFSGGGAQRGPVWAIDGDVVSMVAGRDYVFVVHREGGASLDGNQNLKYTLRASDTYRVMHTGRLPVNKGCVLKWIGISDEGAPVIYDSAERVMMLEHFRFTAQGSWVVLCDAKQLSRRIGKDESYWPVGVSKGTFMAVILKGREEQPGFPRPLAQELDMRMPYLDLDSPETQKEERVARETILLDHLRDMLEDDTLTDDDISRTELDLDKELIQLIQLACKHERLQRALDAAKLLHHTASIDMAVKVADFYHLSGLREKFIVLKSIRASADRLRDERERRRDWKAASGPVLPVTDAFAAAEDALKQLRGASSGQTAFRPRVAPTPSAEPARSTQRMTPSSTMETSSSRTVVESSPPPEKRKRDVSDENDSLGFGGDPTKRRNMESSATSQQTKLNPFAKKTSAINEVQADVSKPNPFKRIPKPTKSLHKSDSFFSKVNAAESQAEKTKRGVKSKKQVQSSGKQMTLDGLNVRSRSTNESQDAEIETQEDVEMNGGDETQESMLSISVRGVSQTLEDTTLEGDTQIETQVDDADEGEPIEWPESPTAMVEAEA